MKFVRRIRNQLLLDTHRENGSALHPAGQRTNGTRARPLWRPARTRSTRPRPGGATTRTLPTTHESGHNPRNGTDEESRATPRRHEPATPSNGPNPTAPERPRKPGTPTCHRTGRARLPSHWFLRSSPVPPGHQEEPSRLLQPENRGRALARLQRREPHPNYTSDAIPLMPTVNVTNPHPHHQRTWRSTPASGVQTEFGNETTAAPPSKEPTRRKRGAA